MKCSNTITTGKRTPFFPLYLSNILYIDKAKLSYKSAQTNGPYTTKKCSFMELFCSIEVFLLVKFLRDWLENIILWDEANLWDEVMK